MVQQHERRLIAAAEGAPRCSPAPPRGGLEGFVGDALGVEDLRKEGNGAAFVPRRIDGVDAQIVRQPRERGLVNGPAPGRRGPRDRWPPARSGRRTIGSEAWKASEAEALAPGEARLVKVGDAGDAPEAQQFSKLIDQGRGGGGNVTPPHGHAQHRRAPGLVGRFQPWGVVANKFRKGNAVDGGHLRRARRELRRRAAPKDHGGHDKPRARGEVIEAAEHRRFGKGQAHLLLELPERRLLRRLPGITPPSRERPLPRMAPQGESPARQEQGRRCRRRRKGRKTGQVRPPLLNHGEGHGGVVMVVHGVHGPGKGRDLGRNDVPEGLA